MLCRCSLSLGWCSEIHLDSWKRGTGVSSPSGGSGTCTKEEGSCVGQRLPICAHWSNLEAAVAADPPAQFPGFCLLISVNLDMPILQCPAGISQMLVTAQEAPSSSFAGYHLLQATSR